MAGIWGTTETPKQSYSGAKDYRGTMSSFLSKYAQQASPMALASKPWSADQYTKVSDPLASRTIDVPAMAAMIRKSSMTPVASTRKK